MILFATQNFFPDVGGQQAYVTGLADALAAHGHSVHVLADTPDTGNAAAADGTRHYPVGRFGGPRPLRRIMKGRAAARLLRAGGVEAIVTDSWKSLEHLPKRLLDGVRVLCQAHGSELLVPEGAKRRRIERTLAKANIVGANSRFTAELVRPFVYPGTEIAVLLPGIVPPVGSASGAKPQRGTGPRLLTIARLEPRKGIDAVLRALPALAQTFPGLAYDIVGDGADRARLAALAAALGIAERVHFLGAVDDARKAECLAATDLFVLANRREPGSVEGFGMVFLEAAAFGVPSLAGKDGGTGDAVLNGETGLVVSADVDTEVAAGLDRLLSDPEMRRRLGENARARFWSEFAWDRAVQRFEGALGLTPRAH